MSYRLERLSIPEYTYSVVPQATVALVTTKASALLRQGQPYISVDISDMEAEEVRTLLSSLQATDERVYVIWPPEQIGIILVYHHLIKYYDELWYPARDDLWVTDDGFNWLLEISHEEILTFIK